MPSIIHPEPSPYTTTAVVLAMGLTAILAPPLLLAMEVGKLLGIVALYPLRWKRRKS